MNLNLDIIKNLRKVNLGSNTISLLILFVFSYAAWSIINDVKIEIEDVPNYSELTKNPYEKFEKLVQKTKLQEVINSGQFMELKYEDSLIKEYESKKEKNLFLKKF
ncbi:MAG: hypothetical protein KAS78_00835 [Candidatus Pacebacteria bacterium]|nr:hypothetical protein [Candidatus Paceibacterota bacterium]